MTASRPGMAHARAIHSAAQPGSFSSPKSHRDLVKSLRALATALVASASSDTAPTVPVSAIAQQLATSAVLQTSRPDIHLGAALCFVELFKLSAPSAPWHGEKLRDVLRLLIKQVALIGDTESAQVMLDQFHILESLAVVKIPIVLFDDDADDPDANLSVLADLFQVSMQIAARGLPQQFENCIRDMLSCVLEEADPIPKPLIIVLLTSVVDRTPGAQRSCDLAKRILLECRGVLEPVLAEIIGEIASAQPSATVKGLGTRSRQSEVIYELAILDAGLLRGATHHLQDALESSDEDLRLQFVKLLGRVFANAESRVANEFSLLLNAFLKRATDISGHIREEFVMRSVQVLAQVHEIRFQLTTILTERVLDTCDRVRAVLVRSVCDLALGSPEVVELPLLDAIGGRLLDKKGAVRQEAIQGLASLFKAHCSRYWSESQPVPASLKKFAWIPSRLIGLFTVTFPDRNQSVDRVLDDVVFDRNLDVAARSLLLAAAYTTCDPLQQKAFIRHYVTDKRQAASLLDDALSLRDRLRGLPEHDHDQIKRLTRQRDQRLQSLTGHLPASIDVKQLQALFEERDGNVFKWLRFSSDTGRDVVEVRTAMSELHGALAVNKKLQAVADAVAASVSMVTLGRDLIPQFFDLGAHHANPKLAAGVRTILLALAEQAPGLFARQLQPMSDAITFPSTDLSEFALHIVALCSAGEVTVSPTVTVLQQFCRCGSEQQSSWAATILSRIPSAISELLSETASGLDRTPKELVPLLVSSATIARLQPQLFHDHDCSKDVVEFALSTMQSPPTSDTVTLIRFALRLMTDYVIGLELNVTRSSDSSHCSYREPLLTRLWDLLADSTTALPVLVTDAFTSILSLMAVPHIEGSMGPHEFAILAGVLLRRPDESVRVAAVDQLWQHLVVLRIPFRYATLLALAAADATESGRRARKLLSVLVGRLRQAAALTQRPPSPAQLPEVALAYMLHALAAQDDFDPSSAAHLRVRARYIGIFLDAVLIGQQHNYEFLIALLTQLRACVPLSGTKHVPRPEGLHALADLALFLVRRRYQGQEWSSSGDEERLSRKIPLPSSWFRKLPAPVTGSHLPPGFSLAESPHATPAARKSTATPRKAPTTQRKRRKPSETLPQKASRQLPPRRAKRSLQSVSSLLNSSDEDNGDDSDVISHEYEGAESIGTSPPETEPMSADPSSPASNADRRSASQSATPVSDTELPLRDRSESVRDSDSCTKVDGDGAISSKGAASQGTSKSATDLIDALMVDENTAPQPMNSAPATAAMRSTFQLRRSRRRP